MGGNPARVIRMRFDADSVARLLALAWWDWPIEKVTRFAPLLTVTTCQGVLPFPL